MKKFISAIFCAPTGAWGKYPDKLTDDVFKALASVGINRIFGFGMDMRDETIIRTMTMCEKYGMGYLVTLPCFWDYTRLVGKDGKKPYAEFSEEEKADLDKRFVAEISRYSKYKAFRGIFFEDETGYVTFPAVAHAKEVFESNFVGYEFHVNLYSYSITEQIFWCGTAESAIPKVKPFELVGNLEIKFENRFRFYEKLVDGLLSQSNFSFISQDRYPFLDFGDTVPTSVHKALFELNAFMKKKSVQYNVKFYNYMQVGQWCGTRSLTKGEMALQMNVTAAYGADGFAFFPGVFPLDWMENCNEAAFGSGACGFIDRQGALTKYVNWVKELDGFFTEIEDDILASRFLGTWAYGNYNNGFDAEKIKDVPDSECIFIGELPEDFRFCDKNIKVKCSNAVMLSVFEREGKRRYYAVNLSSVYSNKVEIELPECEYKVYGGDRVCAKDGKIAQTLGAGYGIYMVPCN